MQHGRPTANAGVTASAVSERRSKLSACTHTRNGPRMLLIERASTLCRIHAYSRHLTRPDGLRIRSPRVQCEQALAKGPNRKRCWPGRRRLGQPRAKFVRTWKFGRLSGASLVFRQMSSSSSSFASSSSYYACLGHPRHHRRLAEVAHCGQQTRCAWAMHGSEVGGVARCWRSVLQKRRGVLLHGWYPQWTSVGGHGRKLRRSGNQLLRSTRAVESRGKLGDGESIRLPQ